MSMSEFVGQTLGQYRIEMPIDAGGMGQVYRGVHIYLNRLAAIKVMRMHLAANPSFRERFLQEARSAAALKHQNIVDIYEFGEQDGQLYLVMELVPDGSLRTLLHRRAKQPWSLDVGLDLMSQAAEGLASAHALGVVHRDIKPDNMLLQHIDTPNALASRYRLKISDFGLARLAEGSGLTATGMPMGTLAYMSPEQCLGGKVDGRTDLYALGVVLYEVATGYLPFQIESFEDALRKHTGSAPTLPSQVRPDIPPTLESIIIRCLEKKPEDRYQTGAELARDLQALVQNAEMRTFGASAPSPSAFPARDDTALRAAGNTPAPLVATLQGYSGQPRVRVLDQDGQTIQVVEITRQGVTIGRQQGNTLVLPSDELSRQHVQVRWEHGQVTITDLGSSNGTMLADRRLQPHISQLWQDRQMVRIGPYWLRLEGVASEEAAIQAPRYGTQSSELVGATSLHQLPVSSAYATGGGRIGVRVDPTNLSITPGQPANVRVTLTNLGTLVDWLAVTTEGVPQEWVHGPGAEVQLNPGTRETVDLMVNVARLPRNRAQNYPLVIRARSREKPGESGTVQARWTVLPFAENTLRVEPRRASGRGSAKYTLAVANNGNVLAEHAFNGEDDEQKMSYQFRQETLALEPGKEVRIPFTAASQRRLIGKEQSQRFQVHSQVKGKPSLSSQAEFVNKALIPPWVLTVLGGVLALCLVLGSVFALLLRSPSNSSTGRPGALQGQATTAITAPTPPPNSIPPMALSPTPVATATMPPMQPMTPPPTKPITTNVFIQQATSANTNGNFTVINATLTNKEPNAGIFITQNVTPGGNGRVFNAHEEGVWFNNQNWAVFNEDDMPLSAQSAFNVWIPKNAQFSFVQQATPANISGSGTAINNPMVNNNPNVVLLVTQNWDPNGSGGVFDPHPIGVTYDSGSWAIFNEDGAAMPPQAAFNVRVLSASTSIFVQTATSTNMQDGGTIIDNSLIDKNPNAIILITQVWNPGGATTGVYNNHPVGLAFDGTHWTIVNEDQTPIPQGVSFNVVIVQH